MKSASYTLDRLLREIEQICACRCHEDPDLVALEAHDENCQWLHAVVAAKMRKALKEGYKGDIPAALYADVVVTEMDCPMAKELW